MTWDRADEFMNQETEGVLVSGCVCVCMQASPGPAGHPRGALPGASGWGLVPPARCREMLDAMGLLHVPLCCRRQRTRESQRTRTKRLHDRPRAKSSPTGVAVVGATANYLFDGDDEQLGRSTGLAGSGAVRAAWAMFAYLHANENATFIAITEQRDDAVRERRWQGVRVLQGGSACLRALLRGQTFEIALAATLANDALEFTLELWAQRRFAAVHSFSELPYGPLSVLTHDSSAQHVRPRLEQQAALLARLTTLAPSESVAAYVTRFGGGGDGLASRVCYAAACGYFEPRPAPHDLSDGQHRYVTCISACPHKGLSVLLGVARVLPHVQFAAVATSWTREEDRLMVKLEPNVCLLEARADVDAAVYAHTRVLLAPSVWAEAFGLVALEAGLRGIPCVSSDSGGLSEANPLPELVVPTPLVYDLPNRALLRGASQRGALVGKPGGRPAPPSEEPNAVRVREAMSRMAAATNGDERRFLVATEVASPSEVAGYVARLEPLLRSEAELKRVSEAALAAARVRVEEQGRTGLRTLLRA